MIDSTASVHAAALPVKKSIEVNAPREVAFRVFTAEMTTWWDLETHHIGAARATAAVIEPRVGGRWFERGEDGSECDWGKVLVWEPPSRLVLAWQISAAWKFDPTLRTELDVRFVEVEGGATRVELEHRLLEAYGEKAAEMTATFESPQGWARVLDQFAQAAKRSIHV